jgi:death-on-curing protein
VARPYHGYHRSIARKASALLEGVGNGQGFLDGNKRTAVILTNLLIEASGYALLLRDAESLEDLMVDVASNNIGGDELWRWFKDHLVKIG